MKKKQNKLGGGQGATLLRAALLAAIPAVFAAGVFDHAVRGADVEIDDTHLSHDTEAGLVESDNDLFSVTSKTIRLRSHRPTDPLNPAPPTRPPGWPDNAPDPTWSDWSNYVFKEVNPVGPLKHANVSGNLFGGNIVAEEDSETVVRVKVAQMKLAELQNADSESFDVTGVIESKRTSPPAGGGGGGKPAKDVEQTYDKNWDVKVKYPRFDMTVDADNSGEIGGDDHKKQNEAPSKYVPVNDTDDNRDGIPGFVQLTAPDLPLTPVRLRVSSVVDLANSKITFRCSSASPLLPLGGANTVYAPTGKVRLWKAGGARTAAQLLVPGTAYPAKELVEQGVFIEGVSASVEAADIEVTADFDGRTLGGGTFTMKDKLRVTTYKVDVDMDSDNDEAITASSYNLEDQAETKAGETGKIIQVDETDGDNDGRPGFADGFNKFPNVERDDAPAADQKFAPLKIKLSEALDLDKVRLRLVYAASIPDNVEQSGKDPEFAYRPALGNLRVWTKDGTAAGLDLRKKESVAAGGHFVPPDVLLTPAQLKMQGREKTLYVEGIRGSDAAGDMPVRVEVLPLPAEAGGKHFDEVRMTALGVDLAVDFNRDGSIEFEPYGGGSPDATRNKDKKRFEFWVNSDDDQLYEQNTLFYDETEEDDRDVAESHHQNWQSNSIDCKRDLEDFSRLWVDTSRLASVMPQLQSGEFKLKLRRAAGSDAGIKLFRAVDPKGGTGYLEDPVHAEQQVSGAARNAFGETGFTAAAEIPKEWVNPAEGYIPLLFEGEFASKGGIVPVLVNAQGHEIIVGRGVCLDLKDPKDFIERYTCGEGSGGEVAPAAALHSGSGPQFPAPATDEEKDYVLYVHGYNMDPNSKQRWIETTFKRLYWQKYKGRVGGFSWPCTFGTTGEPFFDKSEYRAWQSGSPLMGHLNSLKQRGYRVHVMAHSQGNVVAGEALRLWSRGATESLVSTYVAAQAAIPAACYDKQAPLMVPHEEDTYDVYKTYWTVPSDRGRPALWSLDNPSYLDANLTRIAAEKWVNFYNPRDYALTGGTLLHPGWELVQKQKPDNALSTDDSCGYSYMDAFGFWKEGLLTTTFLKFPDDHYRIFAYGAGAWSKSLGACDTQGLFAGSAIDLNTTFLYGEEHLWHSGQFRSFLADRRGYWTEFNKRIIPSTGGNP